MMGSSGILSSLVRFESGSLNIYYFLHYGQEPMFYSELLYVDVLQIHLLEIAGYNRSRKNMLARRAFRQLQILVVEYLEPIVIEVAFMMMLTFSKYLPYFQNSYVDTKQRL